MQPDRQKTTLLDRRLLSALDVSIYSLENLTVSKLFALVGLSVFLVFAAKAATSTGPAVSHKIVGKWQWTRSANNCTEVYDYRSDGTLSVTSGQEIANATYTISERPDPNGFYELKGQPVNSNNAQDCSDSPPDGDMSPYTVYLIFHNTQPAHLVCQTPGLEKCFGPLKRIQP